MIFKRSFSSENAPENPRYSILLLTICLVLTAAILFVLFGHVGSSGITTGTDVAIMDKFDQFVTNNILAELGGKLDVERSYWLNDSDKVAPKPNADCYGQSDDAVSLQWLLDDAAKVLKGQSTLFTTETPIKAGSKVQYYLDDTIFAVTWKQVVNNCTFTFSEVKIAHPSQFRRFLSGGQYGSGVLHTTSEMATSINAVVASAGDYYSYRPGGLVINNGTIHRNIGFNTLDTCYINNDGDLLFTRRGELNKLEELNQFVEENNVRFSLCFGPLMLLNGENCVPGYYSLGEINQIYPRAALCQMDKLHYVVVTANMEEPNYNRPTVAGFAKSLQDMGIPTAYTLDGGQTATIVMNNQVINTVSYGAEREISDIIYFATAIPSGQAD